jgi:fucose permease
MSTPRSTLAISFASTFVIGILSGALGPLLPQLAGRAAVPLEALGAMFTALFLGALLTQFSGGWLNERVGLRNMVMIGTGLLTAGILGITVSPSLPLILFCAFLAGSGQGTLDISTNVLIAAVFEERAVVSAVNLLHFAFGAGAVIAPLLISLSLGAWETPMPVLWLAAMLGAATLLWAPRGLMNARAGRPEAPGRALAGSIYASPVLWLLGLLMFLYVGVEMGVGGWTTVYASRTTALAPKAIAWLVSGYWLALTVGRLLGAAAGARLTSRALAMVSIAGTCAGALVLVGTGGSVGGTIAGTLLLGVSFGPIFPTAVVIGTEVFRSAPSRAVSVIISLSSLGGMVLPALQGVLLERVSPLASVWQIVVACFGMLLLLLVVERAGSAGKGAPAAPGAAADGS